MEISGWGALSTASIVVGLLLILTGGILEFYNVGRGGISAAVISMVSTPVALLYLFLVYFEWYSNVRSIAAAHIGLNLVYALQIWQSIGGNVVYEAAFYNGVSDWIAFVGALFVTLGMLPFAGSSGVQIKLKRES